MGTPENRISDFVELLKSWIPRKSEPGNFSKDFWMPDHSCRVCYDCDVQFTVFNRRHHCRLCGRVFCAKCTANSIPAPSVEPNTVWEDWEKVRVCNFCFKQWQQGIVATDNGNSVASSGISPSPSAMSLASIKSGGTCNCCSSTVVSTLYTTGPYEHVPCSSGPRPCKCAQVDSTAGEQDNAASGRSTNPSADTLYTSQNEFGYYLDSTRSDDDDYEYGAYHSDSKARNLSHAGEYYGPVTNGDVESIYGPHKMHHVGGQVDAEHLSCSPIPKSLNAQVMCRIENVVEDTEKHYSDGCEAPSYDVERTNAKPMDIESNALLWLPPEPENEEDEKEALLLDDEDYDGGTSGEWGYVCPSNSFGSRENQSRDKSSEEHGKAMSNVVEGHFRALVAQLLQVENLQVVDENDGESWLEIITSLSWEAATLLKPDTSKGGGMDPGGYVKVKCIACGHRSESVVVKGVVCKKNVAHRRMMSKIDQPRFLILGGALEYQRVSNLLSSVDTLLQQEMDHLKMAVARIDARHPNVLLVEKSVSRYAQEYLLAKDISLVLNIKRPLLERVARCTGAQIVPSIDHLTSQKLGYCDFFHVEKFLEDHGSAGQSGKRFTKTLMFFEGCPKPLGYTILLKGSNGDELKKVKHVVQYGVFAAYHLALETSFLADEGASFPELPLKSPITVALPDKPSSIERSISTIPGFTVPGTGKYSGSQPISERAKSDKGAAGLQTPNKSIISGRDLSNKLDPGCNLESNNLTSLSGGSSCQSGYMKPATSLIKPPSFLSSLSYSGQYVSGPCHSNLSSNHVPRKDNNIDTENSFLAKEPKKAGFDGHNFSTSFGTSVALEHGNDADGNDCAAKCWATPEFSSSKQDGNAHGEIGSSKEEFPPSPSDHQSILVSLSTRCVWKGTVCERAHVLRIKYYGSFDKPLGRFLRDNLFDQSYRCHSCEMQSEAHVHCYTHRQGSLTISVTKLSEIILSGEREGKIWMWHRCLRCPLNNGFPPATQRVVMSDAAWGLSFGKFLELSFSNHAAASRVASCGHSLHRDCLRFYGFGRMVACFRYASIDVYSVYLPPSKVEFNCDKQGWIQEEANEVRHKAELLFNEVQNALHRISEKMLCAGSQDADTKATELSRLHIAELEGILQTEKGEYEESLWKTLSREVKVGQPAIDILEINKLRQQMLFHSYVWDQRLVYAASLSSTSLQGGQRSFIPKLKQKHANSVEKLVEMDATSRPSKGFSSCDSYLQEKNSEIHLNQGGNDVHACQPGGVHEGWDKDQDLNPRKETEHYLSSSANIVQTSDPLESGKTVRRAHSEGEFSTMASCPASTTSKENDYFLPDSTLVKEDAANLDLKNYVVDKVVYPLGSASDTKVSHNVESSLGGAGMPFPNLYTSVTRSSLLNVQQNGFSEHSPAHISLFRDFKRQSGAKFILPMGVNDTIVPVFDDEPTSIIACALVSSDYQVQMSELEKGDSSVSSSLLDSVNLLSLNSLGVSSSDTYKSLGSTDGSILPTSGSRGSQTLDLLYYTKDLHARVSLTDDDSLGKVKYTVTCYYAKRFKALRRSCCPSELDFIRSLSRCKKWGAQGGKSSVFFAKTLDDRFIIKQVTKTELESFIKFGPAYFKYLSESIGTRSPTCLAKILGIYQVSSKHLKGGKESKMDVLVMENLLFRRNVTRLYDLKGSSRSRYNPDTSGSNKVLLDQNLIEAMPTSPIFVGNKAKRLLERAVWNDTSFLASVDAMDYSLLVGVDEEKHELVLGIIDFMRPYTWDKHLETWVKTAGILGGSKNTTPTVISPQQYKKRFRKAMTAYFLMVPDQWSTPKISASGSQSDLGEETLAAGPP